MIILYSSINSSSCRNARNWFKKYDIQYKERNISRNGITLQQLSNILKLTQNGTSDVISKRSSAYHQLKLKLNDLSFDNFITLLCQTPSLIRTPIIISNNICQIGFNKDAIRRFVPRDVRQKEIMDALD